MQGNILRFLRTPEFLGMSDPLRNPSSKVEDDCDFSYCVYGTLHNDDPSSENYYNTNSE